MPCTIQVQDHELQVADAAVADLIAAALDVISHGVIDAVGSFNAAEDAVRLTAIRAHRQEPWRAFLSPAAEKMESLLAQIGLKAIVEIPPLKPIGSSPRHEMKPGCGGDNWASGE